MRERLPYRCIYFHFRGKDQSRMSLSSLTCAHHTLLLLFLFITALPTPTHSQDGSGDVLFITSKTCANSFTLLEEDLLSREENRYNLLQAYYPRRSALPVFVTVTYSFNQSNQTIWYWSVSQFYLIQPLNVLQFTSLFHSNFPHRQRELELVLSEECSEAGDELLESLTQRVRKEFNYEAILISLGYHILPCTHLKTIRHSLQIILHNVHSSSTFQ